MIFRIENKNVVKERNYLRIFRKYNVFEYKRPDETVTYDLFFKNNVLDCLNKTYGEQEIKQIKEDEITMTLMRNRKPQRLFAELKENGYMISEEYEGVYYIYGGGIFPTQIIIGRTLPVDEYTWLKNSVKNKEIFIEKEKRGLCFYKYQRRMDMVETLLRIMASANKKLFDKMMAEKGFNTIDELIDDLLKNNDSNVKL